MKEKLTITIDRDLRKRLEQKARNENRSLSNLIETLLASEFFDEHETTDKFMGGIIPSGAEIIEGSYAKDASGEHIEIEIHGLRKRLWFGKDDGDTEVVINPAEVLSIAEIPTQWTQDDIDDILRTFDNDLYRLKKHVHLGALEKIEKKQTLLQQYEDAIELLSEIDREGELWIRNH